LINVSLLFVIGCLLSYSTASAQCCLYLCMPLHWPISAYLFLSSFASYRQVSLYPGVVRTEGNLELDAREEWDAASGGLDLSLGR